MVTVAMQSVYVLFQTALESALTFFITFFLPYKRAGTHFSIHPAKRQYTPPSKKELEKLLLAFQIRGLFARLHRFYRKKLPAVRWLPFFASQWFITLNIASQFGYLVQFFKKFQYSLILNAFRCSSSECGLQVFQWAGPCRLSPHILCFGCAALLQRMTGSWPAYQ